MTKPLAVEVTQEANWKSQYLARNKVLKQGIAIHTKFEKLQKDPLFKELIGEMYIKTEAERLVELIADPETNSVDQQRSIQMRLGGISSLQCFLRQYGQAGETAKAELAQNNMVLAKLDQGMTAEDILAEMEG